MTHLQRRKKHLTPKKLFKNIYQLTGNFLQKAQVQFHTNLCPVPWFSTYSKQALHAVYQSLESGPSFPKQAFL